MHRRTLAALTNNRQHDNHPLHWQETWARLLVLLAIWLCATISIRYGFSGDCHMLLGPSSSRLFQTSCVFVEQVEVTASDRKGVDLYGFSQKPELSREENWSVSNYMIVGRYSRQGYSLWLNKGSTIQIGYQAEQSSLDQLEVSIIKGEGEYERLLPRNSPCSDIFNYVKHCREVECTTEEDDRYNIGITNLNGRSIMVVMNISVSSKMYDTSKAESMCSTRSGSCHLKLLFPNTQYVLVTTPNDGDINGWHIELSFIARFAAYITILGVTVIIIFLALKLLGICAEENHELEQIVTGVPTETAPLLPQKAFRLRYGTDEDDQESGTDSSSEDLYDGKICVICYDMPRNCFFVPCGHCATCQDCVNRIMEVENRICPICRRVVQKARKLIIT